MLLKHKIKIIYFLFKYTYSAKGSLYYILKDLFLPSKVSALFWWVRNLK
jgi:hypothetical protein